MTASRSRLATALALREQLRHPLLIVLLFGLPVFFITRSIAITEPLPRLIELPGGVPLNTTMRELHGANMAAITIGFLAALSGQFVMYTAREGDRRLVTAGFSPWEALVPRLVTLLVATAVVVAVSLVVTALSFEPEQWLGFVVASLLIGITYAGIGCLAGASLGRLGGTYFVFFLPMLDIGIAQNPMFGDGTPDSWAWFLPGYGPVRVSLDAAFATSMHAWGELVVSLIWSFVIALVVIRLLARSLGGRDYVASGRAAATYRSG